MPRPVKYKKVAALNLASLRPEGITQSKVAGYFGLSTEHGYKSIVDWEAGVAKPNKERRAAFIGYLWDALALRHAPHEFERIWQVLVEEWAWTPINDEEWQQYFPGVPRRGWERQNVVPPLSPRAATDETLYLTRAAGSSAPVTTSTRLWSKWLNVRRWQWFVATLLLLAGLSSGLYVITNSRPACTGNLGLPALAGVININCKGLLALKDYEMWFTSKANGRWQIWHLDPQAGAVAPYDLKSKGQPLLLDQFVPAISPDGLQMAFAAGSCNDARVCNRDLYIVNLYENSTQQLITDPTLSAILDEYHPSWSPDGKRLAYHAGNLTMPYGIWVIDLVSRQVHQLTASGEYDPVWSPSGRYIAYHTASPSTLKVLDYSTCGEKVNSCKTSPVIASASFAATSPSWMNEHTLVFASNQGQHWNIYKIPVTSERPLVNPQQVTKNDFDNVYPAVFDAQLLLWQTFPHEVRGNQGVATDRYAEIYFMNLRDGEEIPLLTGIGNVRNGFLQRRH